MTKRLLADSDILNDRIWVFAQPNYPEGIGVVEAPRGTLFHHYKTDEHGLIIWVNLIVATGNNNLAMNRRLFQVARHFLDSRQLTDAVNNRMQAVIRAFDPCLSCSTHYLGEEGVAIELIAADGRLLDCF